jgi:hypothetical protein
MADRDIDPLSIAGGTQMEGLTFPRASLSLQAVNWFLDSKVGP